MDDAAPTRPAGFWIRAIALVIDCVIFVLVQASFSRLARLLWGPAPDGTMYKMMQIDYTRKK